MAGPALWRPWHAALARGQWPARLQGGREAGPCSGVAGVGSGIRAATARIFVCGAPNSRGVQLVGASTAVPRHLQRAWQPRTSQQHLMRMGAAAGRLWCAETEQQPVGGGGVWRRLASVAAVPGGGSIGWRLTQSKQTRAGLALCCAAPWLRLSCRCGAGTAAAHPGRVPPAFLPCRSTCPLTCAHARPAPSAGASPRPRWVCVIHLL